MTDGITGCTHFGHANTILLINRMSERLVYNWIAAARPQSTTYHPGHRIKKGGPDAAYRPHLNGRLA